MAKLVHSMIRVLEEERSVRFYREALGLEVADRLDFEEFTLLYLSNGDSAFELELTVNKGRMARYEVGTGYGHLAVVVEDLEAEHARMTAAGLARARSWSSPRAGASWGGSSSWRTRTATKSR
jgi:lactoylglutathione lyase